MFILSIYEYIGMHLIFSKMYHSLVLFDVLEIYSAKLNNLSIFYVQIVHGT